MQLVLEIVDLALQLIFFILFELNLLLLLADQAIVLIFDHLELRIQLCIVLLDELLSLILMLKPDLLFIYYMLVFISFRLRLDLFQLLRLLLVGRFQLS